MNPSRLTRIAIVGAAVASVAVLSSCEKPAPGVTVVSGTSSQHRQALCWSFSGDPLTPDTCAQDIVEQATSDGRVATIPVTPGDTIGISVDTAVANVGWYPAVGSQRLTQDPIYSTYFRFTYPDLQPVPAAGVALQVIAGKGDETRGLWVFTLVPASGTPTAPSPGPSATPTSTASVS